MNKHVTLWTGPVLVVPRWALSLMYLSISVLGVLIAMASSTVWQNSGGPPEEIWGFALALGATCSAVFGSHGRWVRWEKYSGLFTVALLLGFAAAPLQTLFEGDWSVDVYAWLAIIVATTPAMRVVTLIKGK